MFLSQRTSDCSSVMDLRRHDEFQLRYLSATPISCSGWEKRPFGETFNNGLLKWFETVIKVSFGMSRKLDGTGLGRFNTCQKACQKECRRPHVKTTFVYASQTSTAAIVCKVFRLSRFIMHNTFKLNLFCCDWRYSFSFRWEIWNS